MELWDWSLSNCTDTEMKARIRGVESFMTEFKFLFGCKIGKMVCGHTDNLSRALQNAMITAAEGQDVAQNIVEVSCFCCLCTE